MTDKKCSVCDVVDNNETVIVDDCSSCYQPVCDDCWEERGCCEEEGDAV